MILYEWEGERVSARDEIKLLLSYNDREKKDIKTRKTLLSFGWKYKFINSNGFRRVVLYICSLTHKRLAKREELSCNWSMNSKKKTLILIHLLCTEFVVYFEIIIWLIWMRVKEIKSGWLNINLAWNMERFLLLVNV